MDGSESFRHSVCMVGDDWKRLASYVVARRVELGYRDRGAFSSVTGVTARTLGKLETGRSVSAPVLAAVEHGLRWEPDSARRVLGGADPLVQGQAEMTPNLQEMTAEERRAVLALLAGFRAPESAQRGA